jgi:mono/diheme cytochrome c family protein
VTITRPALFAALVWLLPVAAHANAADGQRLAQRWCAGCHVIDGGSAGSVPQGPPSFRIVAQRLDAGRLRAFLSRPHAPMPDLSLTRAEIADLVAYIESLR